ncbi:MAG TPA: proton-conducting transporter membrane subunit [Bacteroidales bacterium]|nr:proton-conducting transporter membrane subunit [Bacteroidales bacterium]
MFQYYLILVLVLAAGVFFNRNRAVRGVLLGIFLLLQTSVTIYGYYHIGGQEADGYFSFDALGLIFLSVLTILSFTTILHSLVYLKHREDDWRRQRIYFTALILLIGAMTSVYLASAIGIMWVLIEMTTLSVAALIYHERTHLSLEATWKYVFICSIGITFAFVGIVFLSKALQEGGSVNLAFSDIPLHLQNAGAFWLKLAFIFMVVGFSTKMGLFPMHTITVDAHTVAPPPISAFISTTLMNVGFVAIFRTYTLMSHTCILPWMNQVLLWSGILSVFISTVYILKADHIKRMFAYSSLEHMGLSALGLAAGGIGYFAAILHMVLHSFIKASVFYQIDQVHRTFGTYVISKTGNYFNKNLAGALVMLFVYISITAIPPSGMFVSELLVFRSLFASNHIIVLILILLLLTMIIWSMGKNIFKMLFVPGKDADATIKADIKKWESVSQFILLALGVYLGLNPPSGFVQLIRDAVMLLPQ